MWSIATRSNPICAVRLHAIRCMPSEKESGALHDMLHNIRLAEEFARGHTFESLNADAKTLYALVRTLEIISEASRRVPDAVKARHHHIEWREMAAAGNFY